MSGVGGGKRVRRLGVALATLLAATPVCVTLVLVWWSVAGKIATIVLLPAAAAVSRRSLPGQTASRDPPRRRQAPRSQTEADARIHGWSTVAPGSRPLTATRLATRLWLPDERPAAVLLEALPYRMDDLTASYASEYERLCTEGGFAVCRLDLRGTGSSEGHRDRRIHAPRSTPTSPR